MNLILVHLIAVVLISCCSNGSKLHSRGNEIETSSKEEIETEFSALNYDVLYLIFSRLELTSLMSVVQTNSRNAEVVNDVIGGRYQNYRLDISTASENNGLLSLYEINDKITVYDVPFALDVLKYFGHHFRGLIIQDKNLELNDLMSISRFLIKYCQNSLEELQLKIKHHEILDKFSEPLPSVKDLNIHDMIKRDSVNMAMPLNELFPNLKRFTIYSWYCTNYSFINTKLLQLEHFSISGVNLQELSSNNNENIRKMIRKNPTIRSLELRIDDREIITLISKYLPKLENLKLLCFRIGNDLVQLKMVKRFELTGYNIRFSSIDKLLMPHLESLKMSFDPEDSVELMSFLNKHLQLRQLSLTDSRYLVNEPSIQINELTANLKHLTDVTVGIFDYFGINPIVEFIENHPKLNRFQFAMGIFTTEQERTLRQRYQNEWNIEEFRMDFKGLSFKRKELIEDTD